MIRQSSIDIYTFHLFDVVAFCGVVSLDQGQSSQLFPIWHSCRFHLFLWGSFFHGSMRMTKNTLKQNETKLNQKNLLLNPILWFLSPQSEWRRKMQPILRNRNSPSTDPKGGLLSTYIDLIQKKWFISTCLSHFQSPLSLSFSLFYLIRLIQGVFFFVQGRKKIIIII